MTVANTLSHLSNGHSNGGKKELVILELEGMFADDSVEDGIWSAAPKHNYNIKFIRGNLSPGGDGDSRPISDLSDELCASVDGLMVFRHYLTRKDIERFPKLKVVVRCGVGYDRLDRVALAERNITVCNVPNYGTNEIADHTLALALSLRRGILIHNERQRATPAAPWQPAYSPLVSRIQGQVFGILGLGRIGTAAAIRAKAFGWHVIFYDPYLSQGVDKSLHIERVKSLDELFSRSTIISIHCPHTSETRGLVSTHLLSLLPPGAILINTARGEIVDTDAVEVAMREGNLAGAGLDVLQVEPVPEPVPGLIAAWKAKEKWIEGRMTITPHSAFYSPQSFADIRAYSAETMRDVLVDGLKTNVILPSME